MKSERTNQWRSRGRYCTTIDNIVEVEVCLDNKLDMSIPKSLSFTVASHAALEKFCTSIAFDKMNRPRPVHGYYSFVRRVAVHTTST